MIHINALQAFNIPILTKKIKKAKIYCMSSSSRHYFYKSCKSKEKTVNPIWDLELDIDLFRCHTLTFLLCYSKSSCNKLLIGKVDIDMTSFLTHEKGKQLVENPQKEMQFEFQIKTTIPTESFFHISISYCPIIYPISKLEDIPCSFIHIWTSYSPSNPVNYEVENNPIEISMIQGFLSQIGKSYQGCYCIFDKETQWESVGYSSQNHYFYGPTGLSHINSLCIQRLNHKFEIFVLNVANYEGTVILNLVIEKEKKVKIFNNEKYIVPTIKNKKIGTLMTYEIQCKPNHKYCFPFCLFYEKGSIIYKNFPCLSMKQNPSCSEKLDRNFNNQIIDNVQKTFYKNNSFAKIYQINNEKISLLKHFRENNLPIFI